MQKKSIPYSSAYAPLGERVDRRGVFISRTETGEGVDAERAPLHKLIEPSRALVRFPFGALRKPRAVKGYPSSLGDGVGLRGRMGFAATWIITVRNPLTCLARLMTAPVARHPLPQDI